MIFGIGIDIIEINRIKNKESDLKFIERILTKKEIIILSNYRNTDRRLQFIAGRFAAKEAISKAFGTGIGDLSFKDIEIINDDKGKPIVTKPINYIIHLSISHSESYAVANAVIEKG